MAIRNNGNKRRGFSAHYPRKLFRNVGRGDFSGKRVPPERVAIARSLSAAACRTGPNLSRVVRERNVRFRTVTWPGMTKYGVTKYMSFGEGRSNTILTVAGDQLRDVKEQSKRRSIWFQ